MGVVFVQCMSAAVLLLHHVSNALRQCGMAASGPDANTLRSAL